jgi:hypothetical protein
MDAHNPFTYFYSHSKVTIDDQEMQSYKDMGVKEPVGIKELLDDIQVLGKREVAILIKWMKKIKFI